MTYTKTGYGQLPDGQSVDQVRLRNAQGLEVDIISFGGIITRISTPDSKGQHRNIVLGLDSLDAYRAEDAYLGALIGRYGNRIANGCFHLDGQDYALPCNDGPNHLHGGNEGINLRNWDMQPFQGEQSSGVELHLTSPDGDQGYPGNLEVLARYELFDDNRLELRFQAATDKATPVSLTQHSYFNLAGEGNILDQQLQLFADHFTPARQGLIPTGELRPVAGTALDFRSAKTIGRDIDQDDEQLALGKGFDHNFVVNQQNPGDLHLAARATDPSSGRVLEVWSDAPGIQFYSGNFLDGSLQGDGKVHHRHSGFCLEPQQFPDAPNQSNFPSTILAPGEQYQARIAYRFTTVPD